SIFGSIEFLKREGRDYSDMEVVTTKIEHPSITEAMSQLERLGVIVKYVAVNERGLIILEDLRSKLSAKTVLVSCAYANSEIGAVQPLRAIKKMMAEFESNFSTKILFHVDAAQAPLWLNCQFESVAADFLVLDAGKCCGPKGVGVLLHSRRAKLVAVNYGGGQEAGLRAGTENTASIAGAARAFSLAQKDWKERSGQVGEVRNRGISILLENISGAVLNGGIAEDRLANNINVSIPGLDTEYAVVVLDAKGFAVSTKSACAGAGGGESMVVREISADPARAKSTIRISLGPDTTTGQIESMVNVLKKHMEMMKTVS
ncbi:aminotransferase class V-fold PLP-dependent enzyme, partial [Candidatus Kaiserbacteria bacterium]|nr:aminotransferase class V-fold PLP-dependent enzyme [Candidatus Kaiserbacteria bacterium]